MDVLLGLWEKQLEAARDRVATLQSSLEAHNRRLSTLETELAELRRAAEATATQPEGPPLPASAPPPPPSPAPPVRPPPPRPAMGWRHRARPLLRRPWGWLLALLVVAEAAALVLLARGGGAPAGLLVVAEEPTLVRLQGEVHLWRPSAGGPTAVDGAETVQPGDRVRTEATGRAAITWPSGAVATLDPQSTVVLSPSEGDGVIRVQLMSGALWMDGGPEPGAPLVAALAPDGARVVGPRFQAQRDASGRLVLSTVDAAAVVWGADTPQQVPPASTSEVLPGRRPALPRPLAVPRALAVTVEGPPSWLLVDRFGRAVGAPPGGGPWLDQLPAVRGPLPRAHGATVVVPDPQGEYQLILWAGDEARDYRVAAWATDGRALFGGPAPVEDAAAVRFEGELGAGRRRALAFVVQERSLAALGAGHETDDLPGWLRLAAAPVPPSLGIAAAQPPAPADAHPGLGGSAAEPAEPTGEPASVAEPAGSTVQPAPAAAATARSAAEPAAAAAAVSAATEAAAAPALSAPVGEDTATPAPSAPVGEDTAPSAPIGEDTAAAAPSAPVDDTAEEAASVPATPTPGVGVASFSHSTGPLAPVPAATPTVDATPSPTAALSLLASATPLTLWRSPTPTNTVLPRVEAPALSGTLTVGGSPSPSSAAGGAGALPATPAAAVGSSVAPGMVPGASSAPPGAAERPAPSAPGAGTRTPPPASALSGTKVPTAAATAGPATQGQSATPTARPR